MLSIKKSNFLELFLATLMIFTGCSSPRSGGQPVASSLQSDTVTITETEKNETSLSEDTTAGSSLTEVSEDDAGTQVPTTEQELFETSSEPPVSTDGVTSDAETPSESETEKETVEETTVTTKKSSSKKKKNNKKTSVKADDNKNETEERTETTVKAVSGVEKDGSYTSPEDVAEYIHTFGTLPGNFITKKELKKLGWSGGDVYRYADGKSIGGDRYGNYEGLLPDGSYKECDVNYSGGKRGAERLVFSDDAIYYTDDHYNTFTQLY